MTRRPVKQHGSDFAVRVLHIFVLCSFAFSEPLYDLLSRNAEFFVVRRSEPIDIILLVVLLSILLPVPVILIEALAGLFGKRVRDVMHGLVIACLLAAIVLPALGKFHGCPDILLLVTAALLGVVGAISYLAWQPVRLFVTGLTPALLIFPGLFVSDIQVKKVLFPRDGSVVFVPPVRTHVPIIMVVFDELSLSSLLDENRMIDAIRYPHFAALARDSHWFRNATTIADDTMLALPAILTGNYPTVGKLPIAADYPKNLFSLLDGSYVLNVVEPVTRLSPGRSEEDRPPFMPVRQGPKLRIISLLTDLSVVYLHILLPSGLTADLPGISGTWMDFSNRTTKSPRTVPEGGSGPKDAPEVKRPWRDKDAWTEHAGASFQRDRRKQFLQFVDFIHVTKKPALYFLHTLLPHLPYHYMPSGKEYFGAWDLNGFYQGKWINDEWIVTQGFQRFLLQVGFVDKLIGLLVARMKHIGLYDRSLIVVTSDHGVSFRPGDSRRIITKTNYQDILPVPLFIKTPHQREGLVSDRNVELIDILPTMCETLGIRIPWRIDGSSALDVTQTEQREKYVFTGNKARLVFGATLPIHNETLDRKLSLFGSGARPGGLFRIGPHADLIGKRITEVGVDGLASVSIMLEGTNFFNNSFNLIDVDSKLIPSLIRGYVIGDDGSQLYLGIAVNGTIHAVTRTFHQAGKRTKFSAMVPEAAFRNGTNKIEVFVVSEDNDRIVLHRTKSNSTITYSLQGSETIMASDGTTIPVVAHALYGRLERSLIDGNHVEFGGWAVDVRTRQIPEEILIFIDGTFLYSGRTVLERADVARLYGARWTGFHYRFSAELFKQVEDSRVRFFAVSNDGNASELEYHQGYRWGK